MKRFLIFFGGFIAGMLATVIIGYLIIKANKTNDDGLIGLTVFS